MLSTLLQAQGGGGSSSTWIIMIVLLVVLVVMYIFSYIKRKKYNQETVAMIEALKPGDKVKTYSGIYGTIVSIRETTDGKVITIETGDDKNKSFVTIDSSVIYCMDKKQDVVYDANGDVIEPADDEADAKSKGKAKAKEATPVEAVAEETTEDSETVEADAEDETQQDKKSQKSDQE